MHHETFIFQVVLRYYSTRIVYQAHKNLLFFTVDTSNMKTEGPHALEMAGVEGAERLFDKARTNSIRSNEKKKISSNYSSYYQALSEEEIETVRNIYARDLFVLDYPNSPYINV